MSLAASESIEPLQSSPDETPELDEFDYERSAVAALVGLCGSSAPAAGPPALAKPLIIGGALSSGVARFAMCSSEWDSTASSPTDSPRVIRRKDSSGSLAPGGARFQCRYPGCSKLYASTDAVRKHCRKRHFEWLRRLDQLASHERQMSKPALYCRWSGADGPGVVAPIAS